MVKIASFVDESAVPITRHRGLPNPEVAVIVQQLADAADEGNTQFAFIPVEDKMERRRLGETIRQQARNRGYQMEKVTGTRERKIKGQVVLTQGLYIRFLKPELPEEPVKRIRLKSNGIV